MVELEYVKKRKRRKLVAVVSAISSVVLGIFIIVSFLGQRVGTFTVSLDTGKVKLSLATESAFEKSTSHLVVDKIPAFNTTTYQSIVDREDEVDNENYDSLIGAERNPSGEIIRMEFYKYTFFVKNNSSIRAKYDLDVNITHNESNALDRILRVMVYSNDAEDPSKHEKSVYARASEVANDDGNGGFTYNEFTSVTPDLIEKGWEESYPDPKFAYQFPEEKLVAHIEIPNLSQNKIMRHTIVWWLEGNDPQCVGEPPEDANLKLGVKINAYENQ